MSDINKTSSPGDCGRLEKENAELRKAGAEAVQKHEAWFWWTAIVVFLLICKFVNSCSPNGDGW